MVLLSHVSFLLDWDYRPEMIGPEPSEMLGTGYLIVSDELLPPRIIRRAAQISPACIPGT